MNGETILHYKIIEKLGEGGMGVVYLAEDTKLKRQVAIKFLPHHISANEEERKRFEIEAQAAASLNHPNIATIYAIEEVNEQMFIVMEYIEGKELKDVIERKHAGAEYIQPLQMEVIISYAVQIAEGLDAAHKKGIIHRDIKSSNIMITNDDKVKIMDFGLAKIKGRTQLTKVGSTIGTIDYMSPEQARGEEIDHRTDIWSFGVILYELLTGKLPFTADYDQAIIYSILNENPVSPSGLKPEIPFALNQIIIKCLDKDKNARYQSAKELYKELRKTKTSGRNIKSRLDINFNIPETEAVQNRISGSSFLFSAEESKQRFDLKKLFKREYLSWTILIGLLIYIVFILYTKKGTEGNIFVKFEQLTEQSGQELYPDISPDGNYIIYTKSINGFEHIFFQRIGGGNAIDLTKDSKVDNYQSSFSPEGELIAFRSERDGGGIFLMGSTGESVRRLTNFGYNPAWSPDGKKIIFATESVEQPYSRATVSQLWSADINDGKTQKLYDGDAVQPSLSPNGKWIAYWGLPAGTGQRSIWLIHADGGSSTMITNDDYINWSPAWSSGGKYIYFSSNRGGSMNLWRVKINEGTGKVESDPELVTTPSLYCAMAKMSSSGKKIIYVSADIRDNIYKIDFNPNSEKFFGLPIPVTEGSKQFIYMDISPDNQRIAVSSNGQQEDIYVMRTDGSDILKLTNDIYKDRNPQWSPDGKTLLFYSDRSGKYEIWKIDADGSNLKQLTNTSGIVSVARWFPDGHLITAAYDNIDNILFNLDSAIVRNPKYLPDLNEKGIRFEVHAVSPDGNFITGNRMDKNSGTHLGIIIYSMIQHNYKTISNTGQGPMWFKDSKRILYEDNNKFYVLNTETKAKHPVENSPKILSFWGNYAFAPDNKSIYYIKEEKESDIWMGDLK